MWKTAAALTVSLALASCAPKEQGEVQSDGATSVQRDGGPPIAALAPDAEAERHPDSGNPHFDDAEAGTPTMDPDGGEMPTVDGGGPLDEPEPERLAAFVMAHRGGAGEAPENTLFAFRRALELGVSIEMDVRLTRDGEIVVLHDDTLNRTTNGRGPVAAHTLAEIRRLDAGRGEVVPTLAEVFDLFAEHAPASAFMSIDTKVETPRMYDSLVSLLAGHALFERVFVEVTDERIGEQLRSLDTRVRLAVWAPSNADISRVLSYEHFERIHTRAGYASRAADAHAAGKELTASVQSEREWTRVSRAEIDGINTDFPALLSNLVRARAEPR